MNLLQDLLTADLLLAAVLLVGAGIIRGFTGFGVGLLLTPVLALLFGVIEGVAIIILLNVLVNLQLLPSARRSGSFGSVAWLTAAACMLTPSGAWALGAFDPEIVRRTISVLILISCLIMVSPFQTRIQLRATTLSDATVGGLGGFLNGLCGIGGPPILIYWVAQRNSASLMRAKIIISFAVIHVVTAITFVLQGYITFETIIRVLLLMLPLVLGAWIGANSFNKTSEKLFNWIVLALLCTVSVVTLLI